jgi:hypothetical protein
VTYYQVLVRADKGKGPMLYPLGNRITADKPQYAVNVARTTGRTYRVRACYWDGNLVTEFQNNNGYMGCSDSREIDINGNTP